MKILFATTEAVPFCKTGGLGDVCGSLPRELANLGHEVVLIMPAFRQSRNAGVPIEPTGISFEIPMGGKLVTGSLLRSTLPNSEVPVYLVEQNDYFDRAELYWENGEDYRDNCERFAFFCRAVLEAIPLIDFVPELVHCHDWTAGLVPAYLKTVYAGVPPYDSIATLYTIHNLAYQGNFWHWDMALTGIDWKHFNWQEMEFFGKLSFMKSGLAFADVLSTVSPRYAEEIQSPPLSCGLEGILQSRKNDLHGIINGVDYTSWNPASDPFLTEHQYNDESFCQGKAYWKAALQREMQLPESPDTPLIASVGRLAEQKGFDLIASVMQKWATSANSEQPTMPNAQWVILGTGESKFHELLERLAKQFPNQIAVRLEFSNELAHKIEAGADMFLMPSRYEPCGLNQLYSLKYGTVPIVRETGGLADSIVNYTEATHGNNTATGFSFADFTPDALESAILRACDCFAVRPVWEQLVRRGMLQDWSWAKSAVEYGKLYEQTVARLRQTV